MGVREEGIDCEGFDAGEFEGFSGDEVDGAGFCEGGDGRVGEEERFCCR